MRALALALAVQPALAEGARQTFDCRATLACDGAGACAASDEAVTFILDPVDLGPDGGGVVTIRRGEVEAEAVVAPPLDVSWSENGGPQRLLLSGEAPDGRALLLWHAARPPGGPAAVRFLSCEVTQ